MRKYLDNIDWKKIGKIALVAIPVLVWDVTYFLVSKTYDICTIIDRKGDKLLEMFMKD
jgi:hypothetical protein